LVLANRVPNDVVPAVLAQWPLRILVVDDEDGFCELLIALLTADGHTVARAGDGRTALDTAASFLPDIVMLDLGTPRMNGCAVARCLRRRHDAGLVLVALSREGQQLDLARAAESGFDHSLPTPIEVPSLRAFLGATGEVLNGG